jgi:hypothetical protein
MTIKNFKKNFSTNVEKKISTQITGLSYLLPMSRLDIPRVKEIIILIKNKRKKLKTAASLFIRTDISSTTKDEILKKSDFIKEEIKTLYREALLNVNIDSPEDHGFGERLVQFKLKNIDK